MLLLVHHHQLELLSFKVLKIVFIASSLSKQVADDTAVAGGPWNGRLGVPGGFCGGSGSSTWAKVTTRVWGRPRLQNSRRQGRGQGVDPCRETGPPGQGHEDQVPGGELSLLPAIKESETIDTFTGASLKDTVLKTVPVQKQTGIGQRTQSKTSVATGDNNGHAGWMLSVQRKQPMPSMGPSTWPSSLLSLCGKATGGTRSASPTPPLAR